MNLVLAISRLFILQQLVRSQVLDLPIDHLSYHGNEAGKCWGYEPDCQAVNSFSQQVECSSETDLASGRPSRDVFFDEADFGYVKQRLDSMTVICEPQSPKESSLVCSRHLQFCTGRELLIDFTDLPRRRSELLRYSMTVLKDGQIKGNCKLHKERLESNSEFMAPLQSWAPELRYFNTSGFDISPSAKECEIYVTKPTIFMKLDATVNYYHHFCDFFNLYASLHINSASKSQMYSKDVNILIWENLRYDSNFRIAFKAFTDNPLLDLTSFEGKKVCFKNVILPLLPRMIFGLYYNTPLFSSCKNSGLFRAFSQFLPHRLGVKASDNFSAPSKVRVTIIKRATKFRRILNLRQLVEGLENNGNFDVKVAEFTHEIDFKDQLQTILDTDILIGMHGAGLTHLLFLPDWSTVFELYDCDDPTCYSELARLRGINYVSWTNRSLVYPEDEGKHPTDPSKGHAKFTNYSFDVTEFVKIVSGAADKVKSHPEYLKKSQSTLKEEL